MELFSTMVLSATVTIRGTTRTPRRAASDAGSIAYESVTRPITRGFPRRRREVSSSSSCSSSSPESQSESPPAAGWGIGGHQMGCVDAQGLDDLTEVRVDEHDRPDPDRRNRLATVRCSTNLIRGVLVGPDVVPAHGYSPLLHASAEHPAERTARPRVEVDRIDLGDLGGLVVGSGGIGYRGHSDSSPRSGSGHGHGGNPSAVDPIPGLGRSWPQGPPVNWRRGSIEPRPLRRGLDTPGGLPRSARRSRAPARRRVAIGGRW